MRRSLILLTAAALQGCSQPLLTVRQGGSEALIKAPQDSLAAAKLPLNACVDATADRDGAALVSDVGRIFTEAALFRRDAAAACDVVLVVSKSGRDWSVLAGRSNEELFAVSAAVGAHSQ